MQRVYMLDKDKRNLFIGAIFLIVIILILSIKVIFFNNSFAYAGTLEVYKTDIYARLSAAINTIFVEEGDRITKGQKLVTFDCEDYKINEVLAKSNYIRNQKLVKGKFIAPSDFDVYKNQLDNAVTKVTWCSLSSPINGKVLAKNHENGEWMEPGLRILTLGDLNTLFAYIYVPQPIVHKIALGMKLKGRLPELKNREFIGTVIKISDEAEFTPKNVQTQTERERLVYGIKINFAESNKDEILKPGMTIEVKIP